MNPQTTTLSSWRVLWMEAVVRRAELWQHVRRWAATRHCRGRGRPVPTHVMAAMDALRHPYRLRLLMLNADPTARELAEAAADDLWDATATVHAAMRHMPRDDAPVEHVAAELVEAGRWLAAWPVLVARHDRAMDRLFTGGTP